MVSAFGPHKERRQDWGLCMEKHVKSSLPLFDKYDAEQRTLFGTYISCSDDGNGKDLV